MGYYLALKMNALSGHAKTWGKLETHNTKWKKPTLKVYPQCDFNYRTFQKRQNYGGSKRVGGCQRLGAYVCRKMVNRQGIFILRSPAHFIPEICQQILPPCLKWMSCQAEREQPQYWSSEDIYSGNFTFLCCPSRAVAGLPGLTLRTENIARSAVYTVP